MVTRRAQHVTPRGLCWHWHWRALALSSPSRPRTRSQLWAPGAAHRIRRRTRSNTGRRPFTFTSHTVFSSLGPGDPWAPLCSGGSLRKWARARRTGKEPWRRRGGTKGSRAGDGQRSGHSWGQSGQYCGGVALLLVAAAGIGGAGKATKKSQAKKGKGQLDRKGEE